MDPSVWIGLIGVLVGVVGTKGADLLLQRRAERRSESREAAGALVRERERLEELQRLLRQTKRLFDDQEEVRDRLMAQLRESNPNFRPSSPGYEYWFSELYDEMTPEERTLHQMITGYTEDQLVPANRGVQRWLGESGVFRSGQQPTERRTELAAQLDLLEQHVDGWIVKYHRIFSEERARALVYLADEDRLGPEFPKGVEPALESVLLEMRSGRAYTTEPSRNL
jgi:hypothetical protein